MTHSELTEIRENYTETNKKVDRILSYLENDSSTGRIGIVTEIKDLKSFVKGVNTKLDNFIDNYNTQKAVKKGQIAVISALGGFVAIVAEFLIKLIAG